MTGQDGCKDAEMLLNQIERIIITTQQHWGIISDRRSATDSRMAGKVQGLQRKSPIAANAADFRRDGTG